MWGPSLLLILTKCEKLSLMEHPRVGGVLQTNSHIHTLLLKQCWEHLLKDAHNCNRSRPFMITKLLLTIPVICFEPNSCDMPPPQKNNGCERLEKNEFKVEEVQKLRKFIFPGQLVIMNYSASVKNSLRILLCKTC